MQDEFSHPIRAGQIKDQPLTFTLSATPEQRQALAVRFKLPAIARLDGSFTLQHERAGTIAASLKMQAKITQICVVTLEPFDAKINETIPLRFVPEASLAAPKTLNEDGDEEEDVSPDSLDTPDEIPYNNDTIDLGEALAETLALALDPYPRKPGATLPDVATDTSAHPFAALAARRGKPD